MIQLHQEYFWHLHNECFLFFLLMFLILLSIPSVQKYKNLLPEGIFSCTINLDRLHVQILCNPILSYYILERR